MWKSLLWLDTRASAENVREGERKRSARGKEKISPFP